MLMKRKAAPNRPQKDHRLISFPLVSHRVVVDQET